MTSQNPKIVITGGSAGIGYQLAQAYCADGQDVIALGNRPRSEIVPPLSTGIDYVQCDLGDAEALNSFLDSIQHIPVSLLILNAGTGWYGAVDTQSNRSIRSLFDINLTAPIALSHGLYDSLAANSGHVVFIGTSAIKSQTPLFATYTASKAALAGFARSLSIEWQDQVHVQCIHPGPTRTEMHQRIGMKHTPLMRLFPSAKITAKAIKHKISNRKDHRFGLFFMLRHAITSWRENG